MNLCVEGHQEICYTDEKEKNDFMKVSKYYNLIKYFLTRSVCKSITNSGKYNSIMEDDYFDETYKKEVEVARKEYQEYLLEVKEVEGEYAMKKLITYILCKESNATE